MKLYWILIKQVIYILKNYYLAVMRFPLLTSVLIIKLAALSGLSLNNQCIFDYQLSSNSTYLNFTSCRSYSNYSIDSVKILDWEKCATLCCSNTQNSTIISFKECLKHLNADTSFIEGFIAIFIVLIFVIIVFALLYTVKSFLRFAWNKYVNKNSFEILKQEMITKSVYQIRWHHSLPNEPQSVFFSSQILKGNQSQLAQTKDSICSLCKTNKGELQTFCGHYFHTNCFYIWIQKHTHCPQCPKRQINYIKINCSKCSQYYFILSIQYYNKLGPIALNCKGCATEEQFQNKIVRYYWIDSQSTQVQTSIRKQQQISIDKE